MSSKWTVIQGDCREEMDMLADNSVDAIVTDPPYELGFMGKSWDNSGVAFDPETWRHALQVLKPGGHLLAFSGSRTYHRMACAIEDAGFEIRDQIMWVYGSGFPKSHDVSKAIDREAGAEREIIGTARLNGYGKSNVTQGEYNRNVTEFPKMSDEPATDAARTWSGWGTALKPAHEPIVVARKPFKGTVAQNVLAHGTGALNIDGCRVGTESTICSHRASIGYGGSKVPFTSGSDSGRWPANFIHDGSDEVVAGLGEAARFFYVPKASKRDREEGLDDHDDRLLNRTNPGGIENDPKWAPRVRKNHHPTVKPTGLMRYLCRLITPPGGIVLDPFTGSGSTGKAAILEGLSFIGIEMDPSYIEIAKSRIRFAENQD